VLFVCLAREQVTNKGSELAGTKLCLGWGAGTEETVAVAAPLMMHACDGTFKWDKSFYTPTPAKGTMHGAFYFDPW
jgi:hypothetical protein